MIFDLQEVFRDELEDFMVGETTDCEVEWALEQRVCSEFDWYRYE